MVGNHFYAGDQFDEESVSYFISIRCLREVRMTSFGLYLLPWCLISSTSSDRLALAHIVSHVVKIYILALLSLIRCSFRFYWNNVHSTDQFYSINVLELFVRVRVRVCVRVVMVETN